MSLGWFNRRISDYTMTTYKKALWCTNDKVVLKGFFKVNEPIKNSLGYYFEGKPTYVEKNVEVYVYDITNALQKRLTMEDKTRTDREKKYEKMDYYRSVVERIMDISKIMGDKIKYNYTVSATEKKNLALTIKFISPMEYRAIKELESLVKITKTKKKDEIFELKNIILIVGAIALGYVVLHYGLHII
jgi:hypothetical protein